MAVRRSRARPPKDTDWGMHRGAHVEPDGNIIRFGSPVHDEAAEQSGSLHREEPRV